MEQKAKGKDQSFSTRFAESLFYLFNNLVASNICNSIALIAILVIETLIFLSSFIILMQSSINYTFNDQYTWIKYIDVTFPRLTVPL